MPKKIDDLSIFGEYGQAENRLTVALLQVLKTGGEPLIRHFVEGLGFSIPSSEIAIFSQVAGDGCTPDGLLEIRFSFSLVIESKIRQRAINKRQLEKLTADCSSRGPNATLLYLTPDDAIPESLDQLECEWANWIKVDDVLQSYLDQAEIENRELLAFLIDQFHTFASNLGVLEGGDGQTSRVSWSFRRGTLAGKPSSSACTFVRIGDRSSRAGGSPSTHMVKSTRWRRLWLRPKTMCCLQSSLNSLLWPRSHLI